MQKKMLIYLSLCWITILLPVRIEAQTVLGRKAEVPGAQLDTIAAYIEKFPTNTQISIALANDSVSTFLGFVNTGDGWEFAENEDSVFEIGSITKIFTSTLLATLASEGKLGLDDPISGLLPYELNRSEPDGKAITYKMLSNHTSGLPRLPANILPLARKNPDNPYRNYSQALLREYLEKDLQLQFVPGTSYLYSNLGAGLLGYLLEIRSGINYEQLLLEKVFSQYRMYSSTTRRDNISSKLVRGRGPDGEPVPNWDQNAMKGAGAILSSASDLLAFATANFKDDPVLALQRTKTAGISEHMEMALGWHMILGEAGDTWYFHNGGTGGYSAVMLMDVEHQKAVVILSNVSAMNPESNHIDDLGFALLKTLLLYDSLK